MCVRVTHVPQTSIAKGAKSKGKKDENLPSNEEINAELSAHHVVQLYMQSAIFREKLLFRLAEAEQQLADGLTKGKKGGAAGSKAKSAKKEAEASEAEDKEAKGKGKSKGLRKPINANLPTHDDCC